jgi:hypothetical protein
MTKIILLAFLVSLPLFAQNEELTIVDDPDMTTVDPTRDIPTELPDTNTAELTNNSEEEKTITESPDEELSLEGTDEVAARPEEVETPNPTVDEVKPEEKEKPETIADQTPPPSVSTPVITTEAPEDPRYINHHKSHWISTFAFEGLKYKLPFEFDGVKKDIKDRQQELWGGRAGLGGQLYLGKGFFTTSMVEAYYVGTLTRDAKLANPLVPGEEAGSLKRTGGLYGIDLSQSLGYIFEFRTKNPIMDEWSSLTFEPFVEAGIGIGQAYNSVNYQYDTGGGTGTMEKYRKQIRDNLTNARVGAGFNMTARSGFFFTAKVSVNRYNITQRKTDSYASFDNGTITKVPTETKKNVSIDPITMFVIGGGYKF